MKCLNCGKEIPEGRKFCSSSCSAKYNNVRRVRKPWTEEQRANISERKRTENSTCKYCGKPVSKGHRACSECKPFTQRVLTYKKLGCNCYQCLQKTEEEATKRIVDLYENEKLSSVEFWKQYGIGYTVLRSYLKKANTCFRSHQEAASLALEENRIVPRESSNQYKCGIYKTWEGKKIWYRSSYELKYAIKLDEQRIRYDVEDLRIQYFDTQKKKFRVAIPDFHLLDTGELIEIKSSWTYDEQNMKDKFEAYRKLGYKPKLILEGVEKTL